MLSSDCRLLYFHTAAAKRELYIFDYDISSFTPYGELINFIYRIYAERLSILAPERLPITQMSLHLYPIVIASIGDDVGYYAFWYQQLRAAIRQLLSSYL